MPERIVPGRKTDRVRPVLTGRALVLGGLVVLLVVVLASPVQRYLASRSAVGSSAQQLQQDRAALKSLTAQRQRYNDPAYIQAQARNRLQFAMPGDTVYVVVDKGQRSDIATTRGPTTEPTQDPAWNHRLWDSIREASR